jgi:hypothetical protein
MKLYLKNTHHEKGLIEWLRVKALRSNPVPVFQKTKKRIQGEKAFSMKETHRRSPQSRTC